MDTVKNTAPKIRSFGGRFEVTEIIQVGGFGTVYMANDTVLGNKVAIKVPHKEVEGMGRQEIEVRFRQEWMLAAMLSHPGFPHIIVQGGEGVGLESTPYYAMSLVVGKEFTKLVDPECTVPPRLAIAMMTEALGSLYALHKLGYVHRDLKPGNLMLRSDGRVVVMDLGNAKAMRPEVARALGMGTAAYTRAEIVIASPGYAAPEQLTHGGELDERTDLYSLMVVFWQLITGRTEVPRRIDRMRNESDSNLDTVPVQLRSMLIGGLRSDIAERSYRDVPQLIEAFDQVVETLPEDNGAAFFQAHCPDAPRSIHTRTPIMLPSFALVGGTEVDAHEPISPVMLRHPAVVASETMTLPPLPAPTDTDEQELVEAVAPIAASIWRPRLVIASLALVVIPLLFIVGTVMTSNSGDDGVETVALPIVQPDAQVILNETSEAKVSSLDDGVIIKTTIPSPKIKSPETRREIKPVDVAKVTLAKAPLPVAAEPPSPAPRGTVKVHNPPAAIRLKGETGIVPVPGEVPPGTYKIEAKFDAASSFVEQGTITVALGATVKIVCDLQFQTCR